MPSEHKERRKEKKKEKKKKQRQHQKPRSEVKIENVETEEKNVVQQVSETGVTEDLSQFSRAKQTYSDVQEHGACQQEIDEILQHHSSRKSKCWSDGDIPVEKREISLMTNLLQLPAPLLFGPSRTTAMVPTTITNSNMTTDEVPVTSTSISAQSTSDFLTASNTSTAMPSRTCTGAVNTEYSTYSGKVIIRDLEDGTVQLGWPDKSDKIFRCWFEGNFRFEELNPSQSQTARVVEQSGDSSTGQMELETTSKAKVPTANGSTDNTAFSVRISNTEPIDTSVTAVEDISVVTAALPMARNIKVLRKTSTSNTQATYPDGCLTQETSGGPRTSTKSAKSLSEWNNENKLKLIEDVSNWIKRKKLEYGRDTIFKRDWTYHLCSKVKKVAQRNKPVSYDGSTVKDLLRFIRNLYCHYYELAPDIREALGSRRENIMDYFAARFPSLLDKTYHVMKRFAKENGFRCYYETE